MPWQQLDLAALDLTELQVRASVQLIERDGTTHAGAAAAARLLRAQHASGWRLLGHAIDAPLLRLLARSAYRWVAENRSRLGWLTRLLRRGTRATTADLAVPDRIMRIAVPRR